MGPGKRRFAYVALLALVCLPTARALAEDGGARSLGRGGVGRADGTDASSDELNLASLSLAPIYVIYAGAELGPDGRFLARGGAVDSRTSAVTLGAGYRRLSDDAEPAGAELPGWKLPDEDLDNPATTQRVHLGAALPFLERRMSFAAHTRFDWRDSELGGKEYAFNFGFSVAGRPVPSLTIAAGGRNLLPSKLTRVTRVGDLAVRFAPGDDFGIEADVVAPLDATFGIDRFQWRAGLDVGVVDWLALRGGWAMESGRHSASAGIGLRSEKATLDYGVKLALDGSLRSWHALDVRVNF